MKEAVVYGTNQCRFCNKAMDLLDSHNIPYIYQNIATDPDTKRWLTEEEGHTTVPQIYQIEPDVRYIGGYEELQQLFAPL